MGSHLKLLSVNDLTMASRAAARIIRSARLLSEAPASLRSWARAKNCLASYAGSPKVHSEDTQGEGAEQATRAATVEEEQRQRRRDSEDTRPSSPPTTSILSSPSLILENSSVNSVADPFFQQTRSCHTRPNDPKDPIGAVECVGMDGTPAVDQKDEGKDDYRDYYKEHKPSPLSEVEFVDTRVPIRQATDHTKHDDEYGRKEVIGWSEEQLDTAEQALLRAEAMFRAAAERGDPDTPWGRILAGVRRY